MILSLVFVPVVITGTYAGYVYLYKKPKLVDEALNLTKERFSSESLEFDKEAWENIYKKMDYGTLNTVVAMLNVIVNGTGEDDLSELTTKLKKSDKHLNKIGFSVYVDQNQGLPLFNTIAE